MEENSRLAKLTHSCVQHKALPSGGIGRRLDSSRLTNTLDKTTSRPRGETT